ncbi:MAG: RNA methyltransferase [Ahniella sp.]|nr:RNA methyltransferase [Ahniella sp.]
MLSHLLIVLVETSHPGNIGSTARAMKNMGLKRLALVAPREFPHEEATALAAGADDVLAEARVFDTLDDAIAPCHLVFGTTARPRHNEAPSLTPRDAAAMVLREAYLGLNVALVFGTERTGLTNAELDRCRHAVRIPANPEFSSLNLAQAVQVLTYELRLASLELVEPDLPSEPRDLASAGDFEGFMGHLERTLGLIDFYKGREYTRLLQRFRRLYQRAALDRQEVQLLRGMLAEAERAARIAAATRNPPGSV